MLKMSRRTHPLHSTTRCLTALSIIMSLSFTIRAQCPPRSVLGGWPGRSHVLYTFNSNVPEAVRSGFRTAFTQWQYANNYSNNSQVTFQEVTGAAAANAKIVILTGDLTRTDPSTGQTYAPGAETTR